MRDLVLVANARMPSQRAQSLQVAQVVSSFARQGTRSTLLYAKRRDTPVRSAQELWRYYDTEGTAEARAIPCADWIDAVPRKLQFVPARLQELTFARNAAKAVRLNFADAFVLSREIETAHTLKDRSGVFLEIHRVPGGKTRSKWLLEAAAAASGVIAISGGVKEDLIARGIDAEKILVAHDGFEPARFANLPDKAAARTELGLAVDRPTVVYTGGLLAWKGVEVLVEAAKGLDAQVVIAGGMEADVARIRTLASGLDNVRVDGFQPPSKVALYLAAADLGVVPNRSKPAISARYTSPLKVFEAMAVGLPLVVSDLPSLRDVLDGSVCAFAAPDDAASLRAALTGLLEDEGRRGAMGATLRARATEHSWDARAKTLLDWMESRA